MSDAGDPVAGNPIPGRFYRRQNVAAFLEWVVEHWTSPVGPDALVDRVAPSIAELNLLLASANLAPRQMEAVRLRFALGEFRTLRGIRGEVASEMNITEGAVRATLNSARDKLLSAVRRQLET